MQEVEKKLFEEMALSQSPRNRVLVSLGKNLKLLSAVDVGLSQSPRNRVLVSLILPDEGNAFEDPLSQSPRNRVLVSLKIFRMRVLTGRMFLVSIPS